MMKKQLLAAAAVLSLLFSAGCSTVPNEDKTAQVQSAETAPAEEQAKTIGEIAGLGDTAAAWEAQFGHPFAQGDTLKLYAGGTYKVVFEQDRAVTITLPSQDGTNPLNEKLLPRDGEKQSENTQETGDLTMTVEKWHSTALQNAIPDTKGIYTIMKNTKGDTYHDIIIDCTPNLQK